MNQMLASKTAGMLVQIKEAVTKINHTIDEIAAASKEQNSSITETTLSMNQVNKIVQQHSSISEETASA